MIQGLLMWRDAHAAQEQVRRTVISADALPAILAAHTPQECECCAAVFFPLDEQSTDYRSHAAYQAGWPQYEDGGV